MIIRTVLGDIEPETLGACLPHEHLIARFPPPHDAPDLTLDDEARAIEELRRFKAAGGCALVEMTTPDTGRDPRALRRISEAADVHIIAATGHNQETFCAPFLRDTAVETLAARFIREVRNGMDDTDIRAGVIKAASTLDAISPLAETLFRAAAHAHHATGALISTHTEAGTMALEQVALLRACGVAPSRILIGHTDRKLDWTMHHALARTGVYMGFDQIGKTKYAPDEARAAFIARLIREGHGQQIVLAGDRARRSGWGAYTTGQAGFAHVLTAFVPMLHDHGVTTAQIEMLLVGNPARALAFDPR